MDQYLGKYTGKKATALRAQTFDRKSLGERGLKYERLDQLTIEVLLRSPARLATVQIEL